MDSLLQYLFGAATLLPRGECLLWRPDLVALHATSDGLIALAYVAIALAALSFVAQREGLRPVERRVAGLFALFLGLCALSHLGSVVTLWLPGHGAHGLVKVAAGIVAAYAALSLWSLAPRFRMLLSPADLQRVNEQLQDEIAAHRSTLEKLKEAEAEINRTLDARTRELRETTQRFALTLRGSGVTVFQQDRELTYTWMYNPPPPFEAASFIGRSDREMLPQETYDCVATAKRQVLESGETVVVEAPFPAEDRARWYKLFIEPLLEEDEVVGVSCVAVDITEEKAVENQLRVVLRELTHRTKNILMIVQAIARQTARTVENPAEFIKRFSARLSALAGAHDILVNRAWTGASLRELVEDQLAYLPEGPREAVTLEGPPLELSANQAQNVALAIHELSTNATRHGALSTEEGTVSLNWEVESGPTERFAVVVWQETGGPPVGEPRSSGFGRLMLEKLVPDALSGEAKLSFPPGGLEWRLRFPLDR